MATKVKLKDVRLSFNDLFEAVQFQGKGEYRYRAVVLLAKGSPQLKQIETAIIAEAKKMWPTDFSKKLASFKGNNQKFCIKDGDLTDTDGDAGNFVLAANRKMKDGRPTTIDRNKSPLQETDGKLYSGCYVNASVEIWAQDGTNAGVRCALLGVQFDHDGDAFSGGTKPSEDDFDDLSEGAGTAQSDEAGSDESLF